ncbi:MAG: bifunctional glutamate N-acetyltransferase/amino-acid acetyltransferase ArgJ [Pseudomonadota bacterium]
MAVGYTGLPRLAPVAGLRVSTVCAGIKKPGRRDLVLFELAEGTTSVATFTRNAFSAAPVVLAKSHLQQVAPRFLLINTGNANAGTGERGMSDAVASCDALASTTGCRPEQVLPFSTGVIGEPLPLSRITGALPELVAALGEDNWEAAAYGILTTDTVPKGVSRQFELNGSPVTITGIAKGSGMIRPDMGTMLAYVATDAEVAQTTLQGLLNDAVNGSFNRITVDGDTSTNDACVLMATGKSGSIVEEGSEAHSLFARELHSLMVALAQQIVRDGEGATKFISVRVDGGRTEQECAEVAYTIAHSPLVKTALFASDPNWGRILAAVGRARLPALELERVAIYLDDVCIVSGGGRDPAYTEERGQGVMEQEELEIRVELGRGGATSTVWTCDLSYDYVRINADYRT